MIGKSDILEKRKPSRQSGVELIKVIAIFCVICSHTVQTLEMGSAPGVSFCAICSHVVQTLENLSTSIPFSDHLINFAAATTDLTNFVLALFRYAGLLGNTIFFVCSAWFLLDSKKAKAEKAITMLLDIWVISALILSAVLIIRKGNVSCGLILNALLPTAYSTNWYLTLYLLFYFAHPYINAAIVSLTKDRLLKLVFASSFIYILFNYFFGGTYAASNFIYWLTIYALIAYIKFYLPEFSNNIRANLILLFVGIFGNIAMILLTNVLELAGVDIPGIVLGNAPVMGTGLLRWNSSCSPFFIMIAIAALNLGRQMTFSSRFINYVSSLSLLIYITHENILLRLFDRPMIWHTIYEKFGHQYVLLWVLAVIAGLFVFWFTVCSIYNFTLRKIVTALSKKLANALRNRYRKIEAKLLKLN